ncbi:hypothetical protein HPG69_014556 [Diceros bicornis minor]|uniref:Uncharacterized protein n=1 Tax=Diceros bicornis minor TaxID=77932 RepID=A0A7J7E3Z1_DICBM|nr:hypothetical protein HPG69_014556 [Diceros bicornis minor]
MLVFPAWGAVGVMVNHVILAACEEDEEGLSVAEGDTLISTDYEIWGKRQRVFFHKYAQVEEKTWDWKAGSRVLTGAQRTDNGEVPSPGRIIRRETGDGQGEVPSHRSTERTSTMRKSSQNWIAQLCKL